MEAGFQLFLFSVQATTIRQAREAGIDGLVVDWESRGKESRQSGFDTQINHDTVDDLRRTRELFAGTILCRVNSDHPGREEEIEAAIAGGADEIMLPMVRTPREVLLALEQIRGRARLGILLETREALNHASDFAALPLSRVYLGLNDLAIERGEPNIFRFLLEAGLPELRQSFRCPFGFGGLTLPEAGDPIPCALLMGEMARLDCRFSFLRRSFLRDIQGREMGHEVPRIRQALRKNFDRSPERIQADRLALEAAILKIEA
ncbi:MAG: aldolase/citrate lyase family protein [bacterium]